MDRRGVERQLDRVALLNRDALAQHGDNLGSAEVGDQVGFGTGGFDKRDDARDAVDRIDSYVFRARAENDGSPAPSRRAPLIGAETPLSKINRKRRRYRSSP